MVIQKNIIQKKKKKIVEQSGGFDLAISCSASLCAVFIPFIALPWTLYHGYNRKNEITASMNGIPFLPIVLVGIGLLAGACLLETAGVVIKATKTPNTLELGVNSSGTPNIAVTNTPMDTILYILTATGGIFTIIASIIAGVTYYHMKITESK